MEFINIDVTGLSPHILRSWDDAQFLGWNPSILYAKIMEDNMKKPGTWTEKTVVDTITFALALNFSLSGTNGKDKTEKRTNTARLKKFITDQGIASKPKSVKDITFSRMCIAYANVYLQIRKVLIDLIRPNPKYSGDLLPFYQDPLTAKMAFMLQVITLEQAKEVLKAHSVLTKTEANFEKSVELLEADSLMSKEMIEKIRASGVFTTGQKTEIPADIVRVIHAAAGKSASAGSTKEELLDSVELINSAVKGFNTMKTIRLFNPDAKVIGMIEELGIDEGEEEED